MNANDKQIGGWHYKNEGLPDHWDVVYALQWCYLVGAATKYLWRLGRKGDESQKLEDLDKAIHYLQKKREQLVDGKAASVLSDREKELARSWQRCEYCRLILTACECGGAGPGYVNQD